DGTEAHNRKLSLRRAYTVKNHIQKEFGIPESLLKAVGYGEALPLEPNTCERNKQMNRRVEVERWLED
ncbi:MAG: OmpA family protein, partial [Desulfamplus sp.]|nr:OmpA family protein [Desulfamplus sp.]